MNNLLIHVLGPENKDKWDPIWVKCFNSIQNLPYKIKIWTDNEVENIVKQDNQNFYNDISHLPFIYKLDYVRYIIMRDYGGIYIDLDVEILNNFIPLLNSNKLYLMEGTSGCYIENSIMANINKQPYFWDDLKNFIKNKTYINLKKAIDPKNVMSITGPMAMSEFIAKEKLERYGLELEILSRYHFASLTNEISFARHYNSNSWLK